MNILESNNKLKRKAKNKWIFKRLVKNTKEWKNLVPSVGTPVRDRETDEKFAFIENTPVIQKKGNLVIGIRTSKFKYFRDRNDPSKRVHLFNLHEDPFEEKNVASSRPDIIEKMEKYISKISYTEDLDSKIPDKKESKIIKNELKKLGYD